MPTYSRRKKPSSSANRNGNMLVSRHYDVPSVSGHQSIPLGFRRHNVPSSPNLPSGLQRHKIPKPLAPIYHTPSCINQNVTVNQYLPSESTNHDLPLGSITNQYIPCVSPNQYIPFETSDRQQYYISGFTNHNLASEFSPSMFPHQYIPSLSPNQYMASMAPNQYIPPGINGDGQFEYRNGFAPQNRPFVAPSRYSQCDHEVISLFFNIF